MKFYKMKRSLRCLWYVSKQFSNLKVEFRSKLLCDPAKLLSFLAQIFNKTYWQNTLLEVEVTCRVFFFFFFFTIRGERKNPGRETGTLARNKCFIITSLSRMIHRQRVRRKVETPKVFVSRCNGDDRALCNWLRVICQLQWRSTV